MSSDIGGDLWYWILKSEGSLEMERRKKIVFVLFLRYREKGIRKARNEENKKGQLQLIPGYKEKVLFCIRLTENILIKHCCIKNTLLYRSNTVSNKNETNSIHIKLRLSTGIPSSIKSILNKANVFFLPEIIEVNIIILLLTI